MSYQPITATPPRLRNERTSAKQNGGHVTRLDGHRADCSAWLVVVEHLHLSAKKPAGRSIAGVQHPCPTRPVDPEELAAP